MPADIMEKNSSSPVAATPASVNTTPDKPKTASEHRKSSKPIMEKRRRARINESLSQLKTLILDALKKDSSRHSKLEKADILEMTVKHLRNLQRAQMTAALSTDPSVLGKYRAGFSECMNEVTRFLSTCEGVNTEVRTRLLGHLANCMTQINAMTYPGQPHPALQAPPPPRQDPEVRSTRRSRRHRHWCPSPGVRRPSRRRALQAGQPGWRGGKGIRRLPGGPGSRWPVCLPHPQRGLRSQRPGHPSLHQQQRDLRGPQRSVAFQRPLAHGGLHVEALAELRGSSHPSPQTPQPTSLPLGH